MKNLLTIVVALFVLCSTAPVHASDQTHFAYPLTKVSGEYFTQAKLEHDIDSFAYLPFAKRNVPSEVFEQRYVSFKTQFYKKLIPLLKEGFNEVEQGERDSPPKRIDAKYRTDQLKRYLFRIRRSTESILTSDKDTTYDRYYEYNATDRILHYDAYIKVLPSGDIDVTEKIKVYASRKVGSDIRHGIVRTFPQEYKMKSGFTTDVHWNVTSVTCNGDSVKYDAALEKVTIGDPMKELSCGIYTYIISYSTDRQLRYYKDYDELAWNVTGSEWQLSMDSVCSEVELPSGAEIHSNNCYTGKTGSKISNCTGYSVSSNKYAFHTTKGLAANEGLTISVSFNKGIVKAPSTNDNISTFLWSNLGFFTSIILLLLYALFGYYVSGTYRRSGGEIIIPQFAPPAGLSPADVGFLDLRKYDQRLFASEIVYAAVNKYIRLTVTKAGPSITYQLASLNKPASGESRDIISTWIADASPMLINEKLLTQGLAELNAKIDKVLRVEDIMSNYFKDKWYLRWYSTFFFLIVFVCSFYEMIKYQNWISFIPMTYVVAAGFIHYRIRKTSKQYTNESTEVVAYIKGFKMFLNTAEADRLNFANPPAMTPDLFEQFLPFAIALGVENNWGKLFDKIMTEAVANGTYKPALSYVGYGTGGYYSSMYYSSFSSHIASSVSSNTSSSSFSSSGGTYSGGSSGGSYGSGGGGSSGDGGGGGGGGGW